MYYNFDLAEFPSAEGPGISVFYKDKGGSLFHTYSAYARETENVLNSYNYLYLVQTGRDEDGLPFTMLWSAITIATRIAVAKCRTLDL